MDGLFASAHWLERTASGIRYQAASGIVWQVSGIIVAAYQSPRDTSTGFWEYCQGRTVPSCGAEVAKRGDIGVSARSECGKRSIHSSELGESNGTKYSGRENTTAHRRAQEDSRQGE